MFIILACIFISVALSTYSKKAVGPSYHKTLITMVSLGRKLSTNNASLIWVMGMIISGMVVSSRFHCFKIFYISSKCYGSKISILFRIYLYRFRKYLTLINRLVLNIDKHKTVSKILASILLIAITN